MFVNLIRPLLNMWQYHTVLLARPGTGNNEAVPVSTDYPLPVIVVGGGDQTEGTPGVPDFSEDDAWAGIRLFKSAPGIPARLLPLDRLRCGALELSPAPAGQPFEINQFRVEGDALWVALPDIVTVLRWSDLSLPATVEARMMVFRGGTWVPWSGVGSTSPDPLPVPVINNVLYDEGSQTLVVNLAAPVPGADIQVLAAAGFVMTGTTAGADTQVVIPLLPQPGQTVTVRVISGGSEAVGSYTFPDASAPPVLSSVTYDDANQQLVMVTAEIAPTGYMFVARDSGQVVIGAYSLGLPQLEHRLSLPPRPGETISIELWQGGAALSSTPFTFPGTPAPAPTTWPINGLTWTSTDPWFNDQGWWATAGGAVLTGTGFTPGGGAALEFEIQGGVVDIHWRAASGEVITGGQLQAGLYQLQIPEGAAQVVVTSYDPAQYGSLWITNFSIFTPAS